MPRLRSESWTWTSNVPITRDGERTARGAKDARVREVIERWTGAEDDTTHAAKQDGRPRLLASPIPWRS